MDTPALVQAIQASAISEWMRGSLKSLPVIEAVHVMAIAVVFGTILIVDLRLLGFPDTKRSFTRTSDELLRWTWSAFAIAVVTGALMFAANASTYYVNAMFRWKLVALLCAGVNMAVFQLVTNRTVAGWDRNVPTSPAGRVTGALSILLWVTVIFLGRGIGFTKGYDFAVPEDAEIDLEYLQ